MLTYGWAIKLTISLLRPIDCAQYNNSDLSWRAIDGHERVVLTGALFGIGLVWVPVWLHIYAKSIAKSHMTSGENIIMAKTLSSALNESLDLDPVSARVSKYIYIRRDVARSCYILCCYILIPYRLQGRTQGHRSHGRRYCGAAHDLSWLLSCVDEENSGAGRSHGARADHAAVRGVGDVFGEAREASPTKRSKYAIIYQVLYIF